MKASHKRILVAPLDWGLGHATRCIPVIACLLEQSVQVVIAADGRPLELLKKSFPTLETVRLPGLKINYPKQLPLSFSMVLKAPYFLKSIKEEHHLLKRIVENYQIDAVISDNRYGLYHHEIPTVLITHQLFIQTPFLEKALNKLTHRYVSRFNFCWIPDFEGTKNLSGRLSHQLTTLENLDFVEPLSRFSLIQNDHSDSKSKRKLMAIISGPEPSRTDFEKLIQDQLSEFKEDVLIVRGLVDSNSHSEEYSSGNLHFRSHLDSSEMLKEINNSEVILCRSGYSSIMDLVVLGKQAILVPTPGQTEQEYLAHYLKQKGWFYSQQQKYLNIETDFEKAKKYARVRLKVNHDRLRLKISEFLEKC